MNYLKYLHKIKHNKNFIQLTLINKTLLCISYSTCLTVLPALAEDYPQRDVIVSELEIDMPCAKYQLNGIILFFKREFAKLKYPGYFISMPFLF